MAAYWLPAEGPGPVTGPETLPAEVDVVVAGGGVMGAAAAYWLARAGRSVLLLEQRRLAHGASGRNAGVVLAGLHPAEDLSLLRSTLAEEGIDAGLERTGHLSLATSGPVLDQVRGEVGRRPAYAPPLHVLDRAACEDMLHRRIAPGFAGGRWAPDGHTVHPVRLVHGLAAAARRHGAQVATATTAHRVVPGRGRTLRVLTDRGPVGAAHVVLACGAAAAAFHPSLRAVFRPVRAQMLATEPLPPVFRPAMAVDFGSVYWRQTGDGAIVLGGCRDADPTGEHDGAGEEPNPVVQQALESFLPGAFPGFPPLRVAHRWAATMDGTADGRPLAGPVPGERGLWVLAGFGGHGLPCALGFARALADAVVRERPVPLLSPFDPARFDPVPAGAPRGGPP